MEAALKSPALTPEAYFAQEDGAELPSEYYYGEVFAMSGGTLAHNLISVNLIRLMANQLAGRDCVAFHAGLRVEVEPGGVYTYPDLAVACPPQVDTHSNLLNPTLIAEILSPSTAAYDRGKKFAFYRQITSLRQYVLISQDERTVEVFTREDDGWKLRAYTAEGEVVPLASIDCQLPLADLYLRVELPPGGRLPPRSDPTPEWLR